MEPPFAEPYLQYKSETEYARERIPLKKNISDRVVDSCKTFKIKKSIFFVEVGCEVKHKQL